MQSSSALEGDNGTDPALAVTGALLGKSPSAAHRGRAASPRHIQAELRRGRHLGAAPRARARLPPAAGAGAGGAQAAQWKFPYSLQPRLAAGLAGGARAGTVPRAGKARAGIIPASLRAAQPPLPGPGRLSRALGQAGAAAPPAQGLQATLVRRQICRELNSARVALAVMAKLLSRARLFPLCANVTFSPSENTAPRKGSFGKSKIYRRNLFQRFRFCITVKC